jgi:hypothetical protein
MDLAGFLYSVLGAGYKESKCVVSYYPTDYRVFHTFPSLLLVGPEFWALGASIYYNPKGCIQASFLREAAGLGFIRGFSCRMVDSVFCEQPGYDVAP